jgi:hypothetical protein
MANVNLGPAVTSTPSQLAVLTPVNIAGPTVPGQGGNALRLLGVARGVSVAGAGDAALMPIINSTSWLPTQMVTSNSLLAGVSGSIATATLGLFTAAAGGGTAIKTAAALAGNTSQTAAVVVATTVTAVSQTAQTVFVNIGTTVATGTVDVFLYGFDIS